MDLYDDDDDLGARTVSRKKTDGPAIALAEAYRCGHEAGKAELEAELRRENAELMKLHLNDIAYQQKQAAQLHEVQEIYTGMEGGFVPETAPEGYCLRIIEQMYKATLTANPEKVST